MYILHGRNVLSQKGYGVLNKHHVTPASFYTLLIYAARLNENERQKVRTASEKSKQYENIIFWYEYKDAVNAYNEFSSYIRKNSIFLRPSLKDSFLKIEFLMKTTLIDREISYGDRGERAGVDLWVEACNKMEKEVGPMILELEKHVYEILHLGERPS